jgi:hypothetical protein
MNRSSFKRPIYTTARTVHKPTPPEHRRAASFSRADDASEPLEKFEYVRSQALLTAVASLPCQECGIEGRTQAAHSNEARHGKGRGIKSSDVFTAALCVEHHTQLDQGRDLTRDERQAMWLRAHRCTVHRLVANGLWPAGVAVPEIDV